MNRYYWLVVTADKYELPMFVGMDANEVANYLSVTVGTVRAAEFRNQRGAATGRRIVKVERPEEDTCPLIL